MALIGEASRKSGVGVETIRYYEREGIVPEPERLANGRRNYSDEAISNLKFIKRCRDLGFPLKDARTLLALAQNDKSRCDQARQFGLLQLREVSSKIEELKRLKAALQQLIANCQAGSARCPALAKLQSD